MQPWVIAGTVVLLVAIIVVVFRRRRRRDFDRGVVSHQWLNEHTAQSRDTD